MTCVRHHPPSTSSTGLWMIRLALSQVPSSHLAAPCLLAHTADRHLDVHSIRTTAVAEPCTEGGFITAALKPAKSAPLVAAPGH